MHLESASGSPVCVTWTRPPLLGAQRARNCEAATLPGAASALPAAASDLVLPRPQPPALATPASRPRPRRCRPSCGGPRGGGSYCRHRSTRSCLWSFSTYAGEMSSVLFLYRASPRFRGPGAARSPHPPHLHRAPPLPTSGQSSAVLRAQPDLAKPSGCQSTGPAAVLARIYVCVFIHIFDVCTAPSPTPFFFPQWRHTKKSQES